MENVTIFNDINSGYDFCVKSGNECANHMIKNGIFEYDLIKWCEQFLTLEGTFVDIGAHIGTYSVILSKKCNRVYSFEPQKDIYHCLNKSLHSNNCNNVITQNFGIGSTECKKILHHVSEDGGGSTLRDDLPLPPTIFDEEIEIRTLDSFSIENINFMKIDVEGYELEVIMGALNTLERNNYPPFIFESWNEEWYEEDKGKLIKYIEEIGYNVIPISGTNNMYLASKKLIVESTLPISIHEKIYNLVRQHRIKGEHSLAYELAKECLSLEPPKNIELLLHEEISVVAYYLDKLDEGYLSCEKVIASNLSWNIKNNTLNNQAFYMRSLPTKKSLNIELPSFILREYKESSTSIIPFDDGFRFNVRLVNYTINNSGGYDIRDQDNIVRTRNILVTADKNLNMLNMVELKDKSNATLYPKNILGMEDIRLFGNNELFCTYLEVNEESIPQMCYGKYCPDTGDVTTILPLKLGHEIKCEKNWIPFIQNGEVYFLYTYNPLHICKLNRETGEVTTEKIIKLNDNYEFRGSSCLIPYKNGWLTTIHQVYYDKVRKYFHRFIWFSNDFTTMKISKVFYFRSPSIEYNLGICHSIDGLLVSYSEKDNNSKIIVVDYTIIDKYIGV